MKQPGIPLLVLAFACPAAFPQGLQDDSRYVARWTALEGVRPAQWRVVWKADPSTEATVSWSTRLPGKQHRVHLGPDQVIEAQVHGEYTPGKDEPGPGAYYHHARLTGLEPGTRVDFRIESDGASSPALHFFTAPAAGTGFEFLYGGDSRTGWRDRCRVNELIAAVAQKRSSVLCFVHGGDYITQGSKRQQWLRWLSHHELTTTTEGRVLPIIPARGNHDFGPCYGEVFDQPGVSGGAWFRTNLGALTLLNLDTNASMLGDQYEWLQGQLKEARPSSRWLMANYHRPMFPAVKSVPESAPYWVSAFESHDVDLVLESDGHCMKRTVPIRDGKLDPTGVTYVGEGGLGVPQRVPDGSRWWFQDGGFTMSGHHVTLVEVGQEALVTRFFRLEDPASVAEGSEPIIPQGARWRYLAGADPDGTWASGGFSDADWPEGEAGFGYGDDDDATVLAGMRHKYQRVYLRRTFEWKPGTHEGRDVALLVDFDDGFVTYLNGVEVVRAGVGEGTGAAATEITSHEAGQPELFRLPRGLLASGTNQLAIEGHNRGAGSSDFSLHPWLVVLPKEAQEPSTLRWTEVDEHRVSVRF